MQVPVVLRPRYTWLQSLALKQRQHGRADKFCVDLTMLTEYLLVH